jgi:fumarate hydratase class I
VFIFEGRKQKIMSEFFYQEPYPIKRDNTEYRKISDEYVSIEKYGEREVLRVDPKGLEVIAQEAMADVSFYLRTAHLEKLRAILDDPEATDNDRFVAYNLLQNATVAAEGQLPSCQDTGTAVVVAKKGEDVYTGATDAEFLSRGIFNTYQNRNLRYSQVVPISMFEEKNSGSNLPAQIDIYSKKGGSYEFLFLAKGGGSANKTFLYQKTKSLLNEEAMVAFVREKIKDLGTAACPPYHLALVIGGTSAEANLAVVKKASAGYYDELPTEGNMGGQAFRDLEWEKHVHKICQESMIGAQFGGKYFTHDVRVIRLPRHAASCPVGLGVSCSADRNIKAKITKEGLFIDIWKSLL